MKKLISIVLAIALFSISMMADDGHIPGGRYCPPDPENPCICPTVADPNAVCQEGGRAMVEDAMFSTKIRLTIANLVRLTSKF